MMDEAAIIMKESKAIAVVGISEKPERPSYDVASYLLAHGYAIIPVNPNLPGMEWRGIKAYATLSEAESDGRRIDAVDIFRKSEDVPRIVDEAVNIKANAVWMQLGIVNEAAAARARGAGLMVVMDKCMKIEHMRITRP
jgi:predicted CoA-binding protein